MRVRGNEDEQIYKNMENRRGAIIRQEILD